VIDGEGTGGEAGPRALYCACPFAHGRTRHDMNCPLDATEEDGLCDRCRPNVMAVFPAYPNPEPCLFDPATWFASLR
jgi:hypothetical protein